MCGIAGFIQRRGEAAIKHVELQLRQLDHRGPDSWGVFARGQAAIGQTRLAVLDLLTGDPPITCEDGSIGVTFNGEIYNFEGLREGLTARGHHLVTAGDTEVIAHLAEELEPAVLAQQLDGMFAFALWDEKRERLVLARDRLGKKPLYYWVGGSEVVFGSEIKAVLAHPGVPRVLAEGAVGAYLSLGYVPSPYTFFEGVQSVPPGHVVTIDKALDVASATYWKPAIPGRDGVPRAELGLEEAAREVRRLLTAAVKRRLVADVPVGAFLSGGMDSSSVVALMAILSSTPVKTFTIGFEDSEQHDERAYARAVASQLGTEHTEFVVQPRATEVLDQITWHFDQPFGDSSALPTFFLSELTRRHVTVALSGDGGDEIFGGYRRFAAGLAVDYVDRLPAPARRLSSMLVDAVPAVALPDRLAGARRFLASAGRGLPDAYVDWVSFVFPSPTREALVGRAGEWAREDLRRHWAATQGAHTLDRLLSVNLNTYLLDDLLPKVDRMSMAHALEVRSPFLDTALVEFALRLPPRARIRGGKLKRVLKASMRELIPDMVLRRPKQGFAVPLDQWFRTDLQAYVEAMLSPPSARVRAHVSPSGLDRVLHEHRQGLAHHGHGLWALLVLELFLRREGW